MLFLLRLVARVLWTVLLVSAHRLVGRRLHPAWSLRIEIVARIARWGAARAAVAPVELVRRAFRDAPLPRALRRAVAIERSLLGAVAVETTTPVRWAPAAGTVLYFHGGGYALCSIGTHREMVARLAVASGARAISVEYRLAPEHSFPAAVNDAWAAYCALLDGGVDPSSVVLAGDSAGGGLCLATLLRARSDGQRLPAAAVLLSPWVDMTPSGESFEQSAAFDYLSRELVTQFAAYYLQGGEPSHPWASPVRAELVGLPPLLVHSGQLEVFRSQQERLVEAARAEGVHVEHLVAPGMFHAWHGFAGLLREGREAIGHAGGFVRAAVGRESRGAAARAGAEPAERGPCE